MLLTRIKYEGKSGFDPDTCFLTQPKDIFLSEGKKLCILGGNFPDLDVADQTTNRLLFLTYCKPRKKKNSHFSGPGPKIKSLISD